MDGFVAWLKQLQFDGVWQTAVLVAASLLCITFHETCHGLVAYWLGDPTAKRAGRLTLNPLRHIDIGGLLMMALFRFGWAKPVPVDMRYFKHPKRDMALTAAAGPLSNILGMLPGVGSKLKDVEIDENAFKKPEAIVRSMTPQERRHPDILNASRRKRIAAGAGVTVQDVNALMRQFEQMRQMVKQMMGNKKGAMRRMAAGMNRPPFR